MQDESYQENKELKGNVANILLVEDNDIDVDLFKIMLIKEELLQCNLHVAENGKEALSFLEKEGSPPIHMILLDINMPVMDGFEFLEKKKNISGLSNVCVVMCSTSQYEHDKKKAKLLGAVGYIVKPATIEQLEAVLPGVMGIHLSKVNGCNFLLREDGNNETQ